MAEIESAWTVCTSTIAECPNINQQNWLPSLQIILSGGMGRPLAIWAVRAMERRVQVEVGSKLAALAVDSTETDQSLFAIIATAHKQFCSAHDCISALERKLAEDGDGITRRFLLRSAAVLDDMVPPSFSDVVYRLLSCTFNEHKSDDMSSTDSFMTGADTLHELCVQLTDLGFSRVVEEAVSWVVFEKIDDVVRKRTMDRIDSRELPKLLDWVDRFVASWINTVLPSVARSSGRLSMDKANDISAMKPIGLSDRDLQLMRWRKRLSFHLYEAVGGIRTDQILTLIAKFPASRPALEDLKDCILSTDQKPIVTRVLKEQFSEKMLNAGTLTTSILQQYVNMIRALQFLDPTGVILENVSGPVRDYLRRRPDTVRCIVSGMTGDGDLYEELEKGRSKASNDTDGDRNMEDDNGLERAARDPEDEDCKSIDGDYDADMRVNAEEYAKWEPEPIDAPPRDGRWRSGRDAIATLVTIYGSSEQIVNEYRVLLADKLVSNLNLDVDRESRILKLLIERFGKDAMHDCSIMLKDVKDSRFALAMARSGKGEARELLANFEATVISKEFWPKLVEEPEFKASAQLEKPMDLFNTSFEELKEPRKLRWQHGLGVVSVTLEFEDGRKVETTVSPIQATILTYFGEQKRWSLNDLKQKLAMDDEKLLRRKLQGLANQGFIRATDSSGSVYETLEHGADIDSAAGELDDDGQGGASADAGDQGSEEAEMAVYESYVMAMLQNLKQLPLEQIHTMLKRFVQTPVYDKTQAQLAAFLAQLTAKGKVELSAGMYRVKAK